MKPILHTLNSGGSGTGLSFYMKYLACPRSAELGQQYPDESFTENYSAALVGVIGHAFMAAHFGGEALSKLAAVQFSDVDILDERARLEAERCFVAFRDIHGPDYFGKVEAVEMQIDDSEAVGTAVGIDPFTCRIDLAVKMAAKDVAQLKKGDLDGAVEDLKPGLWLVDHKFYSKRAANLLDRSMGSFQFTAYQLAYEAATGVKPRGMIQNTIFTTKEVGFRRTVVPYPSREKIAALHAMFAQVVRVMETARDVAIPLDSNCFSWGGVCRWLSEGLCKRY